MDTLESLGIGGAKALEALQTAGLDWTVKREPVYLAGNVEIPGSFAVVRQDTRKALGIVGPVYREGQNRTLASVVDRLMGENVSQVRAGSFGGGRRVYLQALLGEDYEIGPGDVMKSYLSVTASHDGSSPVEVFLSQIRIICQNTYNAARRTAKTDDEAGYQRVRHTRSLGLELGRAQENMALVLAQREEFASKARAMLAVKMGKDGLIHLAQEAGAIPAKADLAKGKAQGIMGELSRLMESGKGSDLPGVRGSLWGMVNVLSEYTDHTRATRGDDKDTARAESAMFGSGQAIKAKAWDVAVSMLA